MIQQTCEQVNAEDDWEKHWPRLEKARWTVLRDRTADEMARGMTLARLATETGVSRSRLEIWLERWSQFHNACNFDFSGQMGEKSGSLLIAEALEKRFAELDEERDLIQVNPGRIETSVMHAVMEGIATARELSVTVLIDAAPGLGKTEGLREYVARSRKAEGFGCPVWTIELREYNLSNKAILAQIAGQCVKGRVDGTTEFSMDQAICEAASGRGGVLIVDEGQILADAIRGVSMLNGLRSFPDRNIFGNTIMGNGENYRRLASGGKYAQLRSRVESHRVQIAGLHAGKPGQPALTEDDVDAFMAAWGVSGVEARRVCMEVVKGVGALRSLAGLFQRSLRRFDAIDAGTLKRIRGS